MVIRIAAAVLVMVMLFLACTGSNETGSKDTKESIPAIRLWTWMGRIGMDKAT